MATGKTSTRKVSDMEASIPTMAPPAHNYGSHGGLDAGFVWQQLSDIQKSLGAMQATMQQHSSAIERLDEKLGGKIGKIESDVSEFKQIRHTTKVVMWIVGITAGTLVTVSGYIAKEAWMAFKPQAIQLQSTPSPGANPPPKP